MTARFARLRRPTVPSEGLRAFAVGLSAIGTKELRGRMRGKRAFIILTINLLALGGFSLMIERMTVQNYSYPGAFIGSAAAQIGQSIFTALLVLQTLLVMLLAPTATSGAISQEREKQTLDMLITTPIPTQSIVVGKLLSALVYVFLLVLAAIPLTALVFVFGGVAPDDVIRGYVVLLAAVVGFGSIGLFFSALLRRTQAATMVSLLVVLGLTAGIGFVWVFVDSLNRSNQWDANGQMIQTSHPPEQLLWLNPVIAQLDVLCGVSGGFGGGTCDPIMYITGGQAVIQAVPQAFPMPARMPGEKGQVDFGGGMVGIVADIAPAGPMRDTFWPKSVATWLGMAVILTLASVRLLNPTKTWRPGVPRIRRRRSGTEAT